MIRFVFIALAVIVMWFLVLKLARDVKRADFDWTGIAAIIGFIAMAFFLREATGLDWP